MKFVHDLRHSYRKKWICEYAIMKMLSDLFILSIVTITAVDSEQTTLINSVVGETVLLRCQNVQGKLVRQWLQPTVTYKGYYSETLTDGWSVNTNLHNFNRLRIVGGENGNQYNLEISNVTTNDSGKYRCTIEGVNTTSYILKVNEPQSTTLEYVSISELGDKSSVDNISELKGRSTVKNVTQVVSSEDFTTRMYLIPLVTSCVIILIGIVAFLLFQAKRRYIAVLKTQRSVSVLRAVDNSIDRANTHRNTNESSHDNVHQPNSFSSPQTINREQLQVDRTTENFQQEPPGGVASGIANQYERFNDRRQNVQHIYDEYEIKIDASATEFRRTEEDPPIYDECGNVYEALIIEHSENNEVNDHIYL